MKPGHFTGRAALDGRLDMPRILLAVSGLYLFVVLGQLVARALGYARRQSWQSTPEEWICEEKTSMLGISISSRIIRIPAGSVVFHSTGSLGDPSLLLTGAFWLFAFVLWGVCRIHTGLLTAAPILIFSGGLLILLGLAVDVGCFLLHQRLFSREAIQFGLLDGSVHTIRDAKPVDAV